MRVLAGVGAIVFLYLGLIPGGLVYSTLDSACAGSGCETSTLSKIGFTALYSLCLVAIWGSAALFAHHAWRGQIETQDRLVRGLIASAAIIGLTVFVIFALTEPLGGGIAFAAALVAYVSIVRRRPEVTGGADAATNGYSPNGHLNGQRLPPPPQ